MRRSLLISGSLSLLLLAACGRKNDNNASDTMARVAPSASMKTDTGIRTDTAHAWDSGLAPAANPTYLNDTNKEAHVNKQLQSGKK